MSEVVHMPGVWQALQVCEEPVAHGLHQRLGGAGFADFIAVLGQNLPERHQQKRRRQQGDLTLHRPLTLRRVQQTGGPGRELLRRRAADHMVHRDPDDLGRDKVGQGAQRRGQHAQKKEKTTAPEKVPEHPSVKKRIRCASIHTGRSFTQG